MVAGWRISNKWSFQEDRPGCGGGDRLLLVALTAMTDETAPVMAPVSGGILVPGEGSNSVEATAAPFLPAVKN